MGHNAKEELIESGMFEDEPTWSAAAQSFGMAGGLCFLHASVRALSCFKQDYPGQSFM